MSVSDDVTTKRAWTRGWDVVVILLCCYFLLCREYCWPLHHPLPMPAGLRSVPCARRLTIRPTSLPAVSPPTNLHPLPSRSHGRLTYRPISLPAVSSPTGNQSTPPATPLTRRLTTNQSTPPAIPRARPSHHPLPQHLSPVSPANRLVQLLITESRVQSRMKLWWYLLYEPSAVIEPSAMA